MIFFEKTRLKTGFECMTVRLIKILSETFRDFQRLSETFRNFQRLPETFDAFCEVLVAKDEYLMLSVKYLNKGRKHFQTYRTVRDTLTRSNIFSLEIIFLNNW